MEGSMPGAIPNRWGERGVAGGVFLIMLLAYNANGREIGSYDSRPTALAARELLLRGTLALNHVVGATPEYANRWGFILAKDGRYRSIYSPVPALATAALTWPFWRTGLIDINAPLAPSLVAKATASTVVSVAVMLAFMTARRWLPRSRAVLLAVGLGLGTGLWSSASQTLWQTESAVLGLSIAVFVFTRQPGPDRAAALVALGLGLALAGTARPQLAPVIVVLLAGVWYRRGAKPAAVVGAVVVACALPLMMANWLWFGHVLGALPLLTDVNSSIHETGPSFSFRPQGFLGQLISPSRGLLIFSPVVLVALPGVRPSLAAGWRSAVPWCGAAVLAQYILYGSYSVWWGGHTYGPRYLLDVLPLLVPLAAVAMAVPRRTKAWSVAGAALLSWSIVTAATGAFCYPNDAWNSDPTDVDRDHARLWSISDNQIRRCWSRGASPQNFRLINRAALRRDVK